VVALDDLSDERRAAHLGDEVRRIRVGAEREIDAVVEETLKTLEGDTAPRVGDRRMGDARARLRDRL
jgi:hypothetical protein